MKFLCTLMSANKYTLLEKGLCEMKRVDFFQLSNKRGCLARDREDPETQTGSLFGWPQINSKKLFFPHRPFVQAIIGPNAHENLEPPNNRAPLIIFTFYPSTPLSFNDCPATPQPRLSLKLIVSNTRYSY